MLTLVRSKSQKRILQQKLERNVKSALKRQGVLTIGHPGGSFTAEVYSNGPGSLWAALGKTFDDNAIARYWNGFGVFDPNSGRQEITVEVNIPINSNSMKVAGYFAENTDTGESFLIHTGKVGGGRPGIGKIKFLYDSNAKTVEVAEGRGRYREGILIGSLSAPDLCSRIWRYVQQVERFKQKAAAGELSTPAFNRSVAQFEVYRREFSGRKSGVVLRSLEYFTYHGDVVDALYQERDKRKIEGEKVLNSPIIDLLVKRRDMLVEVYEVKMETQRQSLYTAIGQLVTHAQGADSAAMKFLVIPAECEIPDDLKRAIKALNIHVRRFTLVGKLSNRKVKLN